MISGKSEDISAQILIFRDIGKLFGHVRAIYFNCLLL